MSARTATVGDVMSVHVVTVGQDAPLAEAARIMDERDLSGMPVVDAGGRLVGAISRTDMVRARVTEFLWQRWPGLAVRHLMSAPALTARADTALAVAARVMEERRVHRLVVVADDGATPIGVVSMSDLLHAIAEGTS